MEKQIKHILTKTNLDRRSAFWFLIISTFALCLTAVFKDINSDVVSSYCFFSLSVIGLILGTKANDNNQKFKLEKIKMEKE